MNKNAPRNLSYGLLVFILVFAPLAFGTVENWSLLVLESAAAAAFLLLAVSPRGGRSVLFKVPGALPLMLLSGLVLVQLLPLPAWIVKVVAPATFEIYRPLLEAGQGEHFITLSLNRGATLLALFTLVAYTLFYMLTVQHLCSPKRLKKTVAVVAVLGPLIAVEAIVQLLTSHGMIYWLRAAPSSSPVGPWVYSNHFAGFMEMIFPLVTALFLFYRPRVRYETTFRERMAELFTLPGANIHLLLACGAVLMALSILMSLSRGGIITLCAAFLFFTVFAAGTSMDRGARRAVFIAVSVIMMFTWFGWQPVISEFGRLWGAAGLDTNGRLPVYLDTLKIFETFPLLGTGAGTFVYVYPTFRGEYGEAVFDHAHNDYLEILAETGAIGFLLGAWFVLSVFLHAGRKLLQRREHYSILVTGGALTGMLALLLHSLADFQLFNGANGLYFFFLCGLAVAGANTRLHARNRDNLLPEISSRLRLAIPCLAALLVLAGSINARTGIISAREMSTPVRHLYLNANMPAAMLEELHGTAVQAGSSDPLESSYFILRGDISTLLHRREKARNEYLRACLLDPMSGTAVQRYALALPDSEAECKGSLLALGIQREPLAVDRYLVYAEWLLENNRRDEAFAVLRSAVEKIPRKMEKTARFFLTRGLDEVEIAGILPPLPSAWYAMGRSLEKRGRREAAQSCYLKAMDFLDNGESLPDYFVRPYSYFRKLKEEDKAIAILRQGIRYLPGHPWFRVELGDYYLRQGVEYRAFEEYRTALQLDPGNMAAAEKLVGIMDMQ